MPQDLATLKKSIETAVKTALTPQQLEQFLRSYLGKKGELTLILKSLSTMPREKRAKMGQEANDLRDYAKKLFDERALELQKQHESTLEKKEWIDVTAPGKKVPQGHLHPLTQVQRKAQEIFQSMGFEIAQGPEIETEQYNFNALNIPKDHPARDMWDTFWIKQKAAKPDRHLLRTHTSPVQVRYMECHTPPLRIIAPGRIFRYEATDARHEINFYQLEGLMVDKNVTAAHFKAILQEFFRRFFGKEAVLRLRPSYFPFTEPSFEVDISCLLCQGKGALQGQKCVSCGGSGWMEIMGAGMVHPNVFKAVGYAPKDWQGFAFGMGVDRLAMMAYKVDDVRLFYSGNLQFLKQF